MTRPLATEVVRGAAPGAIPEAGPEAVPEALPERPPSSREKVCGRRVLLLGGTGDALAIARLLGPQQWYSVAGLGKTPEGLRCEVHVGGYGGVAGLTHFLRDAGIDLVVDATHPYAAQMSRHAALASQACGLACWALRRPPWQPQAGDDWRPVSGWAGVVDAIAVFRRPLFTLGREPLTHLTTIPNTQHWAIRCLPSTSTSTSTSTRAMVIPARGPFTLDGERALFDALGIDVVISKNSGGAATEAKLAVARERGLPVVMLQRPALPEVDRIFGSTAELIQALDLLPAG